MKKLAVFVEGLTERILLTSLIAHVAGDRSLEIVSKRALGGRRFARLLYQVEVRKPESVVPDFYVQIVDSGSDTQVVSDIRELGHSLHTAGFQEIVGLRDLRPIPRAQLDRLEAGIRTSVAASRYRAKLWCR